MLWPLNLIANLLSDASSLPGFGWLAVSKRFDLHFSEMVPLKLFHLEFSSFEWWSKSMPCRAEFQLRSLAGLLGCSRFAGKFVNTFWTRDYWPRLAGFRCAPDEGFCCEVLGNKFSNSKIAIAIIRSNRLVTSSVAGLQANSLRRFAKTSTVLGLREEILASSTRPQRTGISSAL